MDATAYDILEKIAPLPLTGYHYVRVPQGEHHWIDLEVRDGFVVIRGSNPLCIHCNASNTFMVTVDD